MWPYHGTITTDWLDAHGSGVDRKAEEARFYDNCLVYYYFENTREFDDAMLVDIILNTGTIASKARCLTDQEIRQSLSGPEPHYGDGTYVTFHPALHQTHPEIQRHHGARTRLRQWRAVLAINTSSRFFRILQTGGIGLAPGDGSSRPGQLLVVGPPDVKVVAIHRLDSNDQWVRWSP